MGYKELITKTEELSSSEVTNYNLPEHFLNKVQRAISQPNFQLSCKKLIDSSFINNPKYLELTSIIEQLRDVSGELIKINDELDIYLFLKDGYQIDLEGLKKEYEYRGLKEKFPDIDLDRLAELYKNPPKQLSTYYDHTQNINVNHIVFRKFIMAILQMVFNEMDLLMVYTGAEGAGKSTLATQHQLLIHWLLKEGNIVNYPYKIKNMMFNTLASLRSAEDDNFKEKFRQLTLDEGNELHRQNWKEEEVQTFFQRLRRERFNQRIKSICIPVLGELMTNIVMSRVNFIFEVKLATKNKMGILQKGDANMYIIPRGNEIYSYKHKKIISKDHIKQTLYDNLHDKNYLKGLPQELVINTFRFNGVHGFKKEEYEKELKESNQSFQVKSGIKLADTQLYLLYRLILDKRLSAKSIGVKHKEPEYPNLNRFRVMIRDYFVKNPKILRVEEHKFKMKYG